jgi:hypothetical protein
MANVPSFDDTASAAESTAADAASGTKLAQTIGQDAAIGASLGAIVPGIGNVVGGALGAIAGAASFLNGINSKTVPWDNSFWSWLKGSPIAGNAGSTLLAKITGQLNAANRLQVALQWPAIWNSFANGQTFKSSQMADDIANAMGMPTGGGRATTQIAQAALGPLMLSLYKQGTPYAAVKSAATAIGIGYGPDVAAAIAQMFPAQGAPPPAWLGPLFAGFAGLPAPGATPVNTSSPGSAAYPPSSSSSSRFSVISGPMIGGAPAFQSVSQGTATGKVATSFGGMIPGSISGGGWLYNLSSIPPGATVVSVQPASSTVAQQVIPVAGTPTITLGQAHQTVAAAAAGSPPAQNFIGSTIASANTGHANGVGNAEVLALSQRLQIEAKYVQRFVGAAAAQAIMTGAHVGA